MVGNVDEMIGGVGAQDCHQRAAQVAVARGQQCLAAVGQQRELDFGEAKGQRGDGLDAGGGLGGAGSEKFPSGGKAGEQAFDGQRCALRAGQRRFGEHAHLDA